MAEGSNPDLGLGWAHPIGTRDGTLTKDAKMVNCIFEAGEEGMAALKRPGTVDVRNTAGGGGVPQGQFKVNGIPFSIVNDTLINTNTGQQFGMPGVTRLGLLYFVLSDVPFGTTLLKSALGLWIFDGTTVTKVTDPNYPTATVPGIAYLDGVYYVMDATGEVLGSALEDPTTWPALDFIQADVSLGQGAGIVRHLNYISAFYTNGLQLYYDANAALNGQGTALGPVSNAAWTTGCASGGSIIEMGDMTFFLAQDLHYGRSIQQMTGLSMAIISTPFIEKILNRSNLGGVACFGLKISGHYLYSITLSDLNVTLVYDVMTQQWSQWSSLIRGVEQFFIGQNYLNGGTQDLFQDQSTGNVIAMTPTAFTEANGQIPVTIVTPPFTGGTMSMKRFSALYLIADTVNTKVQISYSDDDYQTWSTPRDVDLNTFRKMLNRCGASRRRAWKLTHNDNTTLKLYKTLFDMTVGPG